jgi:cytochrome c-type biogenesis protein CcmH/NrfF
MRRAALLVIALMALALPAAASAATCPQTTLPDVEDEVMCLECRQPLEQSPDAAQAQRERALIVSLIAQCKSKSQIKAALVEQYGDRVLALPPREGFDLTAYVVPALAVLAALAAIAAAALRWRRRGPPTEPPAATGARNGGDSARLDADLERYEL